MKTTNWSAARFGSTELDLDPARWFWLHPDGCTTTYERERAYPVCQHGLRATMLDSDQLGYVRDGRGKDVQTEALAGGHVI